MITELVTFKLAAGATRDAVLAKFEKTAESWQKNPDLVRKYYLFDPVTGVAGGIYLWKTRAHAEKWHGADFRERVRDTYGAEPDSQFFETPIIVDNLTGEIVHDFPQAP